MKLVLLDRDGVLNEDREDFVKTPEELLLLPGVAEGISRLNENNIQVALVTNQSAIGRGIISEDDLQRIHQKLITLLAKNGARLDKIIFCADHPDHATNRRKPGGGMLSEAMVYFGSEPNRTIMIGDSLTDLQAAHQVNCHRMLVMTGKGRKTFESGIPTGLNPVNICTTLPEGVGNILAGRLKMKG